MRSGDAGLALLAVILAATSAVADQGPRLAVGSKSFTESVILGEMLAHLAVDAGATVAHRRQLGGTRILWDALLIGEIDAYPEYTGTITHEILAGEGRALAGEAAIRAALAGRGIGMTRPLGFNNTYAMGMRPETAARLGIRTISDLRKHPELVFGFGNEFMDRGDGWPALRDRYRLPQTDVTGLDHDLAYRGLEGGDIDVMDLYATDAEIAYYGLSVLVDDLGHFPVYDAVIVYRLDLAERAPEVAAALARLAGRIDEATMASLNARVKIDGESESRVAADFVAGTLAVAAEVQETGWIARLWRNTLGHLALVAVSLSAAIVIAIPLGVLAARKPRLGQGILAATGIVQTIPSLALFVFMIPLLGIGGPPAIAALFLYSLLPIVRNTYAGLTDIAPDILESAEAIGLAPGARLGLVELPLAGRAILAGIKTSAVINVGTATLGALIGAGGYGQPILTGIRLDDTGLILEGAVPAAALALLVQGGFELAERLVVPKGLRLGTGA
jgi:osmoprotectant transport system permease protein